jgi:hypothetical protein
MRLREPFAVFFLTQGHVVQHIALFLGSLHVKNTDDEIENTDKQVLADFDYTLKLVQIIHFSYFICDVLQRIARSVLTEKKDTQDRLKREKKSDQK